MGTWTSLTAEDAHSFASYNAKPVGRARGAVVVVQEVLGVNDHIRSVADGFAAEGYHAVAPALFDRLRPDYESGYSQEAVRAGIELMREIEWNCAIRDVNATVNAVQRYGKVGIVGFCWGGSVAWLAGSLFIALFCRGCQDNEREDGRFAAGRQFAFAQAGDRCVEDCRA